MSQFIHLSLISLVIIMVNVHWCVEGAPQMRSIRLCSKGLSDALYLICKGRGFNEPFSYTDGMRSKRSVSSGLVDECCRQPCSLEQLEQYCKPVEAGDSSNGGIEESVRIVNLPFSPKQTVSKEGGENEGMIKSKKRHHRHDASHRENSHADDFPNVFNEQMESLGNSGKRRVDRGEGMKTSGKNDIGKSLFDICQRGRRRRRRCTQAKLKVSLKKVPKFVIGTILPEPNDSLVLFPSKSHKDYRRVTQNFGSDVNKLKNSMTKPVNSWWTHKNP